MIEWFRALFIITGFITWLFLIGSFLGTFA